MAWGIRLDHPQTIQVSSSRMKVGDLVRVREQYLPDDDPDKIGMVIMVDGGISQFDGEPWESYKVQWWHRLGDDTLWYEKGELELVNESR